MALQLWEIHDFTGSNSSGSECLGVIDGEAVGLAGLSSGSFATSTGAFSWTPSGGLVNLIPSQTQARATAISSDGSTICGYYDLSAQVAWFKNSSGLTTLSSGTNRLRAFGLSSNGSVIVGDSIPSGAGTTVAFRWTSGGGVVSLGGLATANISTATGVSGDGSTVCGTSTNSTTGFSNGAEFLAWVWTASGGMVQLALLGPSDGSAAQGISQDGSTIVGLDYTFGGFADPVPVYWDASTGAITQIGSYSLANNQGSYAVNSNGSVIVGGDFLAGFQTENAAFIWTPSAGLQSLSSYCTSGGINMTGITLYRASAISADGQWIAGQGIFPDSPASEFNGFVIGPASASPFLFQFASS